GSKPGAIPLGDPRVVLSSGQRSAGQGSGRRTRTSITCSRGKRPTVSRSPRVSCGSRTRLSRLGTRCLPTRPRTHEIPSLALRVTPAEGEGVEPSRLALARFRGGCHLPLARPSDNTPSLALD